MPRKLLTLLLLALSAYAGLMLPRSLAAYLSGAPAQAVEDDQLREYFIKAGFLYNFPKFTEWPAAAFSDGGAPLALCVLGKDPFGLALKSIDGKPVKDRKIAVRHLSALDPAAACQLLFVSASETAKVKEIVGTLKGRPVLTVSDIDDFSTSGGIITLHTVENKIRFQINVEAARVAGIKFSSKLLTLAEIVGGQPAGGSGQ